MSIRGWIGCLILLCLSLAPAVAVARVAPSSVGSDFNGDGFADLAVGVPFEGGAVSNMGAVNVIYGSPAGLSEEGNQFWTQDSPGVEDGGESTDSFGSALAPGDFDGDGFADLAIGVPLERVDGVRHAGAVNVLYGAPAGLTATGDQLWNQNSLDIQDSAEVNDRFGNSLSSEDYNGDGFADLAVGTDFEDLGTSNAAGALNVLYGSPSGLTAVGNQFWNQDSPDVLDTVERGDHFADALTSGDYNGDGFHDLAAGAYRENVGPVREAGGVNVLYGSPGGLSALGNQHWTQDSDGVDDLAEPADHFGDALASGDFDADGFIDLGVGVPNEDVGDVQNAGSAHVLRGGAGGLSAVGSQLWSQNTPGVANIAEEGDIFAWDLAAADLSADGLADLAVGAPGEYVGGIKDVGAVNVLYGTPDGLGIAGNQFWNQDSPGIEDQIEGLDYFGKVLSASDFDADGAHDLIAGSGHEEVGDLILAGSLNVIYGSPAGLTADGNQVWTQDSPGILDTAEQGDFFGEALA